MACKVFESQSDLGENDFSKTARPPVPGEETITQFRSSKSSSETDAPLGNKTQDLRPDKNKISHSPAASPYKHNHEEKDASATMFETSYEGVKAPLGFEPEGNLADSSPSSESISPPYLRWADNLHSLLSDSEGVALFKQFLEEERNASNEVQFWFACQGLKRKAKSDAGDVSNIVKVIFKTYVRNDKVKCISAETKKEIVCKLNQKSNIDECVFDIAQKEVENYLRDVSYPAFLKSDLFVQYVNNYADSPKASLTYEGSVPQPAFHSGILPVLHEDKELCEEDVPYSAGISHLPYRTRDGYYGDINNSRCMETTVGFHLVSCKDLPFHSHVSYAPVSAQDSELQSVSSDALTDDALTLTDSSSVDGNTTHSRKRYHKMVKTNALQNREYKMGQQTQIIPRTEHGPKVLNIAETNPSLFAKLLSEKLNKVIEKGEIAARMEEKLSFLRQGEEAAVEAASRSFSKNTTATFIPFEPHSGLQEENAESILDHHCSRVWSSSPGYQSPMPKHSDKLATPWSRSKLAQFSASVAAECSEMTVAANTSFPRSYHRSRKDPALSKSFDHGMVTENSLSSRGGTYQHIHYHHHHHHSQQYSKQRVEMEAQQKSVYWHEPQSIEHCRGKTSVKRNSGRKSSASSNVDSGISTVYDTDSSYAVSSWSNRSSDREMKWTTQKEPIKGSTCSGSTDLDRSSSSRRSHRHSSLAATPQSHKQSSKPRTGNHSSGRTALVEHSATHTWGMPGGTVSKQPFVKNPSMSFPYAPNTVTHVEEARVSGSTKTKSFTGASSKDKVRSMSSACMPPPAHVPSAHTVPTDLNSSAMSGSCSTPRPSRTAGSSSQGEKPVVVGIYYDQESYPFRFTLPGPNITLQQIRHLNTKKGSYKYFFKRASDEFGEGAVFEEVKDDNMLVPMWEGKVVANLQKVD